jgi:hypothetical protein
MTGRADIDAVALADAILKAAGSGFQHYMPSSKERIIAVAESAINAAKAEAAHFLSYFESLAKINPAANHALDTARREWAKKMGG